jgi:hypothetical protein
MLLNLGLNAQELSPKVQNAYDACVQLQTTIGSGNTSTLREANRNLKDCKTTYFSSLEIEDEEFQPSFNGHFLFDYEFVDSLIVNRKVYQFAQRYAERCAERSISSSSGEVYTKNCMVGGKASTKMTYVSRGHQEIAFVTEPGGLITIRIHDLKHNKWYNDNTMENEGLPSRIRVFDLPTSEIATIEVEVINRSEKDVSFVVISND